MAVSTFRLPFPELPWFVLDGRVVQFPEGIKTDDFTHTLHRFPGKFVPQVTRELLRLLNVNETGNPILDPFCGSGTLLIEAASNGTKAIGLDIDPLAAFIARAKVTPLRPDQISGLRPFGQKVISLHRSAVTIPPLKNLEHWFTVEATEQLSQIKYRISQIEDPTARDFCYAVFSSIIRRVSNADDQTQKTYVSGTLKKTPPLPSTLFPVFFSRALRGMNDYYLSCRSVPDVFCADAREFSLRQKVSGIATSPPYIDSIDYVYNQLLEYVWMYDVLGMESIEDIKLFRKQPMGFRKQPAKTGLKRLEKSCPSAISLLLPVVEHIEQKSRPEALNVEGYFADFLDHLDSVEKMLPTGARYVLVVGESFVRGVTVPTPEILIQLFTCRGYRLEGRCSYQIKRHYMKFPRRANSKTIKIDHVLSFVKL